MLDLLTEAKHTLSNTIHCSAFWVSHRVELVNTDVSEEPTAPSTEASVNLNIYIRKSPHKNVCTFILFSNENQFCIKSEKIIIFNYIINKSHKYMFTFTN
jgi:hypothetical protein